MASFNSFKGKKKEGMYLRVRTLERMTFQISFLGQISKDEGLRSRRRKKERDEGEKIRHELLRNSVVNIRIKIRESAFPFFYLWKGENLSQNLHQTTAISNRAAMTMMHSSHICDPCQIEPPREGHRPPAIKVTYLIRIQSAANRRASPPTQHLTKIYFPRTSVRSPPRRFFCASP